MDQLVLIVAWLITCGLVYVLGFYLGRGTQEHQGGTEERMVRLPVTAVPPPEGQHPADPKEFPSFYETLPAGERAGGRQAAVTTTVPAPATVTTTSQRPTGTTAPHAATTTLPHTTTATIPRPPAPGAPPPPAPAIPPPAPATPPTPLARPVPPRGGGSWSVEANPTRSRVEAEQLLANLRKRGYDAEMVQVQRDGDTWYRLRVGRYGTAEQANEVMRRLRDVEGVTHAFVASD
jgi:cell division septation protein DedD